MPPCRLIIMGRRKKKKTRRQLYGDRYIESSIRKKVIHRDDDRCCYCGKKRRKKGLFRSAVKLEFGHVVPHSKGGDICIDNIQLECFKCNRKKGAKRQSIGWLKLKLVRGAKGCSKRCKKKK